MQQFNNPFIIPQNNINSQPSAEDLINARRQAQMDADTQAAAQVQEQLNRQAATTQNQVNQPAERQANWFLPINAIQNLGEIGTGLAYMGAHPVATGKAIVDYFKPSFTSENYYKNNGNLFKMALDPAVKLHDFLLSNYDIKASDYADVLSGKQTIGQVLGRAAYNAYKNPVDTALDIATLGALGGANKAAKAATTAGKVEDVIATTQKEVRAKGEKFLDTAQDFKKVGTDADRIGAIEALETGKEVTGTTKQATKVLSKMVDEYDAMIPQYAKVNNFELAHNQRMVRSGKVGSVAEAEKQLERFKNPEIVDETLASLEEGLNQLERGAKPVSQIDFKLVEQLAKKGDDLALDILESKRLFDNKRLKLVPHGIAEVAKSETANAAVAEMADRIFAGQYSTRAFGNAAYKDIAKQLADPNMWADAQMKAFVEGTIAEEIAKNGTMGGQKLVLEGTKPQDVRYLDRKLLEQGKLSEAAGRAIDSVQKSADDIAIDKSILKELKAQLDTTKGVKPFGNSFANDIYQTGKTNALASGGYLAGNFYTGLNNAAMNAGLNPVGMAQDFAEAIATKGRLTKELGLYRRLTRGDTKMTTPILKQVDKYINRPISNALNAVDAKVQNTFAEMAANRNLRSQNIPIKDRISAISDMDKVKLAEALRDVRSIALLQPSRTVLPRSLHGVAGLANPFWRWQDTALQASTYMLRKHPIISDIVYNKFAGEIAFDEEMQNRMNLQVRSDKPFISYRRNPNTNQLEGVTSEFLPAMNTIRFIGDTATAIGDGDISKLPFKIAPQDVPLWSAIINASKGVNKYGKPIRRPEMDRTQQRTITEIFGDSRRRFNSQTGQWEKLGTQADEVLGTTVQEMIAPVRFFNKTAAPMGIGLYNFFTGDNLRYYQPYQNQILGNIGRAGQMPNSANPRSSKAGVESISTLLGQYSRNYDPIYEEYTQDRVTPRDVRRAFRSNARYQGRNEQILNRYR